MPEELSHLPGAPFSAAEVDGAVAEVRGAADWHIAPLKAETIKLDVARYERRLRLPTRRLVSVSAVRNADTGAVIAASTYRVSLDNAQIIRRSGYWPSGAQAVEVDVTHGHMEPPLDLLAVIAEAANMARRGQTLRSVQIDDFQQSFATGPAGGPLSVAEALARHSLTGNPLYGLGIA